MTLDGINNKIIRSVEGEKIFIAHDKTMRKKNYGFASEESASRFFFHANICACALPAQTLQEL